MKNNKPVWSYFLIGVMTALFVSICVCFIVISTGYVDTRRLIVYSGSAEKAFDGSPLTSMQYGVLNGSLKDGHTLVVTTYGSQTEIGKSRNSFHYAIVDQNGSSVTKEYRVIEMPGYLIVHEEGWIDWEKVEKLKEYMDRFGNLDIDASGLDFSDPALGELIKDIDWDALTPEEQQEKLMQMAAMLAAASSGNPDDLKNLLESLGAGEEGAVGGAGDTSGENGGGATGGSGRFDSNLQKKGNGFGEDADREILKVLSQSTGDYYLRCESFGDYNGSGFDQAEVYNNGIVSPLYFAGAAISETARDTFEEVRIENLDGSGAYYLPYYSITGVSSEYSDVRVSKKSDAYSLKSSNYDYVNSSDNYLIANENLRVVEQKYREYVYSSYLTIDQGLKNQLIGLTGFSSSGKQLARDIKNYVQNAATYNLDHGAFPEGKDMVLYFLTEGKEGICQHFAASATMMFRAYGIPARYTCGYKASTVAGEWSVITAKYGHAWVEIYVDGFGWVQVEVTGSAYDSVRTNDISIKTIDVEKKYDGQPFDFDSACGWELTSGSLLSNHKIVGVDENGVVLPEHVGEYENSGFGYKIIDVETGNDVTNRYNVEEITYGTLKVSKRELTVHAGNGKYEYTGTGISHAVIDFELTEDVIPSANTMPGIILTTGDYIYVKQATIQTEIGVYQNDLTYSILDENDQDVTDQYVLTEIDGVLEITLITIKVVTASYEHQYDGQNAICEEFVITADTIGKIAKNHSVRAINGSTEEESLISQIDDVAKNKFKVRVVNFSGEDVTDLYYYIQYTYGDLKVIKRQIVITTGSATTEDGGVTPAKNPTPDSVVNAVEGLPALLSGHKLVVDGEEPEMTKPGWKYNDCKYKVVDSHNNDVSDYYEITYDEQNMGILRVYLTIKITTESGTFEYDHNKMYDAKDNPTYTPELMEGHRLKATSWTEKREPGTYENKCTYKVVDQNGENVTNEYYKLNYEDFGEIKIIVTNPIKLTLETAGKSKVYDGKILNVPNEKCTMTGNLKEGHVLIEEYSKGITDASTVKCISSYKVIETSTGADVTPYYSIELKGELKITKRAISFKTVDKEYVYDSWDDAPDGVFMGNEGDLSMSGSLADGDRYVVVSMQRITEEEVRKSGNNTQMKDYTATIKIINASGKDVTKNYQITTDWGTLMVIILES